MTKFEEEFDNNVKIFDVIGNHNSVCCEVDQVKEVFKDWQPQQSLPVVPKCVADAIAWDEQMDHSIAEILKVIFTASDKDLKEGGLWVKNNPEKYIIARNIGYTVEKYTVEKPKLFYLKNKLTTSYLALDINTGYYEHWGEEIIPRLPDKQGYKISFTQQEIEDMQAGSYEPIEVAE